MRGAAVVGGDPTLPADLETRDLGLESGVRASVDASGGIVVGWGERTPSPGPERAMAVFGIVQPLVTSAPVVLDEMEALHTLEVSGGGDTGVVIWTGAQSGEPLRIHGSRLDAPIGFGPPELLSGTAGDVFVASIDSRPAGDLAVSFMAQGGGQHHLVLWPATSTPGAPIALPDSPGLRPVVALEPSGAAVVGYARANDPLDPNQGTHGLVQRVRPDGSSTQPLRLTSNDTGFFAGSISIALDAAGRGLALAQELDVLLQEGDILGASIR